ncbi:MAG: pilus assembly protein FimV [Cycloclasticus sp. symbiont of Bathymodiolus heckerae]|nr:MAG: pilus assembly protein FimV [Cycloclasticus sp. symbiont of Bathymodiolus heckerae]
MKKSSKAVAAFCLLNSVSAFALGVGEIKTHSALNQVLNAQIPLISSKNEDPSNIIIGIASRETFKKAGIDRPHYLTQLKFTPVIGKNGEVVIDIRSAATIKEPFVNFILEVEWPQGRTLKEFTILLDPPITMSDVRTTPIALAKSPTITPVATTSNQVTAYIAPVSQAAPAKEYGPTKSRDTVWGIAKKLVANDRTVTHQQMMLALYDNNPKAFYKKNINALKKGAILQVPNNEQVNSRSAMQANNEYHDQNVLWSSSTKAATPTTVIAEAKNETQQAAATNNIKKKLENNVEEAKLSLLTPKQEENTGVTVEGNSIDTPVGSNSPKDTANMAIEMATTLEEENKEVKSRLNDLESQVDKLQRLLALKNEQLAQLQTTKTTEITPAPKPAPVQQPAEDTDNNLPLYGGGLVIALLGLFLARRKKKEQSAENDFSVSENPVFTPNVTEETPSENIEEAETSTTSTFIEEEPLLSEFTPSEFDSNIQSQEADPITECDVYIAYGRYQQAEDLINKALSNDPENLGYKLKLVDVHFSSGNADAFEELAASLSSLQDSDPNTWNNIADMGAEICPESSLFLAPLHENTSKNDTADFDEVIDLEAAEEDANDPELQESADTEESSEFEFDFGLIKNETPIDNNETVDDEPKTNEIELELDESEPSKTDESNADTQLGLAQAYIEMEDLESAREALNVVLETGTEAEKNQAQEMLNKM